MIELIVSAPITITFLCTPLSTSFAPICSAYGNPEHAADRSNPHAPFAPILSCTRHAVAGKNMSGVTVATMITSTSAAVIPRFSRHTRAASTARSLVATPLSTMCRVWIPVRSVIHWSLVATIFSRSAFVNTRGGTYVPTELIFARTRTCGFNLRLKLSPHTYPYKLLQNEQPFTDRRSFSPRTAPMSLIHYPLTSPAIKKTHKPSKARPHALHTHPDRYTRHEVTAPRGVGPAGRPSVF